MVTEDFKSDTYIPKRYRKYMATVEFRKGRFYPIYNPLTNTLTLPLELAKHFANALRIHAKINASPDEIINGKYKVYMVYRDNKKTVFVITDKYGNMITTVSYPEQVFKYYSKEKTLLF